jgi:hypothetical protein
MGNCSPNPEDSTLDPRASEASCADSKPDLEAFLRGLQDNKLEAERLLK